MRLICVGRLKAGPEQELYGRYQTRIAPLAKQLGFGKLDCLELRESHAGSTDQRKAIEAEALLAKVTDDAGLIVFDERGTAVTTQRFADQLKVLRDAARRPHFIIGGPDGLDGQVRRHADLVAAFGAMTLPHQIVRVLVAEQIYRAMTVLAGHPYHRS